MEDHAATGIRKKKDSSIHVGLRLVKTGQADAFISAGNSGAVMAGALLILGRLADVERPAIIVKLPTAEGFVVMLDAGANVDCKPSHLAQFAQMGHVYAEVIEGIAKPRIALLSNGSETHKGNELTRGSHELLKKNHQLNYLGYVEGYDLFRGTTDVVVCDGFVGNVTLKLAEGLAETAFRWFRKQIRRDVLGLVGVVLLKRVLQNFKKKFDYQPYGAAPLLGIDGMVLISHGASTEIAIRNGILTARRGVEQSFVKRITEQLEKERKSK
jgi:glycerol-3-phosphate acyltransferase PlsX